ncbi:MAG: BatA domain-containing protein [Puniceicoccaceae bacterium]
MSFLNAILLGGAASIAVPILLELLNRNRIKKVRWAAMRFLRASFEKNRRRLRLEDLILLLVRCLLLMLLAVALARPFLTGDTESKAAGRAVTAILAIDNSYGMQTSDGARTRLEQARAMAEEVLDTLPGGSSAALYLIGENAEPLIALPTGDLSLVRRTIRDFPPSDQASAPLEVPLRQIIERLDAEEDVNGEIYVITDGQDLVLRRPDRVAALADSASGRFPVSLLLLDAEREENLGISRFVPDAELMIADQTARFFVEVTNYGRTPIDNINVDLSLDEDPPAAGAVISRLEPDESDLVAIDIRMPGEGEHIVTASIPDDRLAPDNHMSLAIRVRSRVHVLLVEGRGDPEPSERSLFFLREALQPVPAFERDSFFLQVDTVEAGELGPADMERGDIIVLSEPPFLDEETTEALADFVADGGSLIVFPGPAAATDFLNTTLYEETGLLPAAVSLPETGAERQRVIDDQDLDHAATAIFSGGQAGTLASAFFTRSADLRTDPEIEAGRGARPGPVSTVASFDDGTPAILERDFGRGRVILFASTADNTWNDLPLRAVYVPFVHRLTGYLISRQADALNLGVGQAQTLPFPAEALDRSATIELTGREDVSYRDVRPVELFGERILLRTAPLRLAGGYRAEVGGDPPLGRRFAVQQNPVESSQNYLDETADPDMEASVRVIRDTATDPMEARIRSLRSGAELSRPLLIAVLLLLLAESVLAHRFSRSR